MSVEEYWSKIKEHFLKINEVQKQGESLKIRRKMFIMLNKGNFVLKLPRDRVDVLLRSGEGKPYDPGNGRIMKEWVIIPAEFLDKLIEYAEEAKTLAKSLAK